MKTTKKFINNPKTIPQEVMCGFISANRDCLQMVGEENVIRVKELAANKVGILIGGGITSEPLFMGYVGKNMADCAAIGNINAAPTPFQILHGIQAVNQRKGVLLIYNNYMGDILSFDMAEELADEIGIPTKSVRIWDDVGSAPIDNISERRGLTGIIPVIKIAGGVASVSTDLDEIYRITSLARDNTRTLIVAARSGSYLESGELMFDIPENKIKIGVGIHGETGILECEMQSVDNIANIVLDKLLEDLQCNKSDEIALMVNSMGATSYTELFIINNSISKYLQTKSIRIHHTDIGFFFNSQEMLGFSITLMKLDNELKRYFGFPANSFSYKR